MIENCPRFRPPLPDPLTADSPTFPPHFPRTLGHPLGSRQRVGFGVGRGAHRRRRSMVGSVGACRACRMRPVPCLAVSSYGSAPPTSRIQPTRLHNNAHLSTADTSPRATKPLFPATRPICPLFRYPTTTKQPSKRILGAHFRLVVARQSHQPFELVALPVAGWYVKCRRVLA